MLVKNMLLLLIVATIFLQARDCPLRVEAMFFMKKIDRQVIIAYDKADTDQQKVYLIQNKVNVTGPYNVEDMFQNNKFNGNIDAAFSIVGVRQTRMKADFHFIFSGESYYLYEGNIYRAGPFSIHGENNKEDGYNVINFNLPETVEKVDGAMLFRNGRLYLFSGDLYWRYKLSAQDVYELESGYVDGRDTKLGFKISPDFDSVYSYVGDSTYFVKGDQLYLLDDKTIEMKSGYPVHIGDWLDCGGEDALPTAP